MSVHIDGLDKVLATMAKGMNPAAIAKELHQIGTDTFRESQVNVPSDSGALHGSGRVVHRGTKKASSTITYGSGAVDYSAYVHEGTQSQGAQPYLQQAVDAVTPNMAQRLEEAARKGLGL